MQNFKDYYKILGVNKQASSDDIKQAYRRLARKFHPDVNKSPEAEDKFKDVNEAYEILSDPAKRRQYDQFGQYHQQGDFRSSGAGTGSPFTKNPFSGEDFGFGGFSNGVDFTQFDDFQDFIDQLLGRVGEPSSGRGGGGFTSDPVDTAGYDAEANIQITIPEAYEGGKRRLRIEGGRVLEISIPPGITPGKKIRLKGQGHPTPSGGAGDLYLKVEFREHPFYQLQGSDLYCDLPVSPSEAALGAQVETPTLDGPVKLRIPAGVQSGQKLRLGQRGFPKRGGERGDQFVTIQVIVPEHLSSQERDLYEQLQQVQSYDPRAKLKV